MRLALFAVLCLWAVRAASAAVTGHQYVVGCTILDGNREVLRWFPGSHCVFLDDGSHVRYSVSEKRISRIGPQGEVLWSRPGLVHHQMKLSADKRTLHLLDSEVRDGDFCKVRHEVISVVDVRNGKTLHSWSGARSRKRIAELAVKHSKQGGLLLMFTDPLWSRMFGCECEYTHFNSIAEIPENPVAEKIPAFRKGNYLVNLQNLSVIAIFDRELKDILWVKEIEKPWDAHDAQVLPSGDILIYNNRTFRTQGGVETVSLQRFSPLTGETVWRHPAEAREKHSSVSGGGVQVLEDGVLYNVNNEELGGTAYLVDTSGRTVWRRDFPAANRDKTPFIFQEIKRADVRAFLDRCKL